MSTTISERILQVRGKMKQGDFARLLGINPNTLRNYENGRVLPNQLILERICVQFSISAEWLLLGKGEKDLNNLELNHSVDETTQELKAKVADLEKQLMESKDEIIRAYRLATAHMQPDTDTLQKPKNRTIEPLPLKQTHLSTRAGEKS